MLNYQDPLRLDLGKQIKHSDLFLSFFLLGVGSADPQTQFSLNLRNPVVIN